MTTEVWPTSVHHFVRPLAETSCRSPQKILISLIEDSGKGLWLNTAHPFIWTLSVTIGAPSTSERHCLCYSHNIVHVTPENTYFSYKTYYLLSVILFSKSHRMCSGCFLYQYRLFIQTTSLRGDATNVLAKQNHWFCSRECCTYDSLIELSRRRAARKRTRALGMASNNAPPVQFP